jgi:hypothetical protein
MFRRPKCSKIEVVAPKEKEDKEEKMCQITKARIQTYTHNISHILLHY